jgi:hypothetical protein
LLTRTQHTLHFPSVNQRAQLPPQCFTLPLLSGQHSADTKVSAVLAILRSRTTTLWILRLSSAAKSPFKPGSGSRSLSRGRSFRASSFLDPAGRLNFLTMAELRFWKLVMFWAVVQCKQRGKGSPNRRDLGTLENGLRVFFTDYGKMSSLLVEAWLRLITVSASKINVPSL